MAMVTSWLYDPEERPREPLGRCAICGEDIYDGEPHYNIDGELICDVHLHDWAKKHELYVRGW